MNATTSLDNVDLLQQVASDRYWAIWPEQRDRLLAAFQMYVDTLVGLYGMGSEESLWAWVRPRIMTYNKARFDEPVEGEDAIQAYWIKFIYPGGVLGHALFGGFGVLDRSLVSLVLSASDDEIDCMPPIIVDVAQSDEMPRKRADRWRFEPKHITSYVPGAGLDRAPNRRVQSGAKDAIRSYCAFLNERIDVLSDPTFLPSLLQRKNSLALALWACQAHSILIRVVECNKWYQASGERRRSAIRALVEASMLLVEPRLSDGCDTAGAVASKEDRSA